MVFDLEAKAIGSSPFGEQNHGPLIHCLTRNAITDNYRAHGELERLVESAAIIVSRKA